MSCAKLLSSCSARRATWPVTRRDGVRSCATASGPRLPKSGSRRRGPPSSRTLAHRALLASQSGFVAGQSPMPASIVGFKLLSRGGAELFEALSIFA